MTQQENTPYRERLRILLIIYYFSESFSDSAYPDWARIFRSEVKIQKIDFLFRYPSYFCNELLREYEEKGLPFVRDPWQYLPHMAALSRITCIKLGMHVGRKTYATLKVYQGIPKSLVMLATGHQTEQQFNEY